MSWQRLLGPLDRLPTEGSLEDWHAAALARADGLGTLERAVLGGRLAASPGLAFLAGVDRSMDMARTALNVIGNALAVLVISKWEG
ncbi:cation:dicarboxylate symporter family transporter, partial [Pseudomonas aeruginosa]|uniref:cation:dicarboxylate symporter family transporter n=1 Tax=Pseudomonas aeruginosa TaxID=287 RepID=UPI0035B5B84C